jgi:hypothetical protein
MNASRIEMTGKVARWVFILSLIGYPLFGLLAALMGTDSTATSIPFRILVIALSLLAIGMADRAHLPGRGYRWLWAFWILYTGRLLWDVAVADILDAQTAIAYFAVTVVLPCYALSRTASTWQEYPTAILLVAFGGVSCALAVLMHAFGFGMESSLTEVTGRLSYEAVNPISLGHVAATTLVAALCLVGCRLSLQTRALVGCAVLAAAATLVLAASRGPVLAFGMCAVAFAIFTGRWRLLILAGLLVLPVILDQSSELLARFSDIEYDESSAERIMLQSSAISEFVEHPWFGSVFVEPILKAYPHNLVIETAMALGVVGLALLTVIIARAGVQIRKRLRIRRSQLLLPLLFLQYFLGAQLSGAIWGNSGFWVVMSILVGYPFAYRACREKTPVFVKPERDSEATSLVTGNR